MGQELLEKLVPNLSRVRWPADEATTELGRIAYEKGLATIDEFRGRPQQLATAIRTFSSADSRPYAFAGTAYALIAAAQEEGGTYVPAGLKSAMEWLESAQEMAPDVVSINFIEALIYIHQDRLEDARLVLDYLQNQDAENFRVWTAEIAFWEALEEEEKVIEAYTTALKLAPTVPQRLRLSSDLADALRAFGRLEEAREAYIRARHFDRDNLLLLHKMSTLAFQMDDLDEAERLNKQVLARREFPAAQKLAEMIRMRRDEEGGSGVLGRLFGRG